MHVGCTGRSCGTMRSLGERKGEDVGWKDVS